MNDKNKILTIKGEAPEEIEEFLNDTYINPKPDSTTKE